MAGNSSGRAATEIEGGGLWPARSGNGVCLQRCRVGSSATVHRDGISHPELWCWRQLVGRGDGRAVADQFRQRWSLPQTPGRLTLELSDRLSYAIDLECPDMIELTQQFEFSAAHRLHCPSMSDEENVATFGKCNNLNGHGHNYVVEVTIGNSADYVKEKGAVAPLEEFQSTVKTLVIDRLDHKHLNEDVEYFAEINPSVENISIAIFSWLKGSVGAAELVAVKVYETPKTWAEYRG